MTHNREEHTVNAIIGKLLALVIQYGIGYLRKHPEVLKHVSDNIPGHLDDTVLLVLSRILGV